LAAGLVAPGAVWAQGQAESEALGQSGGAVTVRDLLGRTVTLPRPAQRLVLGAGRYLGVLNLLHPDPASLVVGWNDDLRRGQPGEYEAFRRRFPTLDAVPMLSRGNEPMHAEAVLALRPDLVVLTRSAALDGQLQAPAPGTQPSAGTLMRTLEAAGVPVVVVDFFQQPLTDTQPSLAILGRLLGREDQASRLLAFYRTRLERLRKLSVPAQDMPAVMMHAHAGGLDCCYSPGRGTFNEFIAMAGGHNIGADKLPGVVGQLGLEYVLTRKFEVYVATGGPYGGRGGVSLGAGITEAAARDSLAQMLRTQRLDGLAAVRNGRAHAIWHGFNDSPAHLLAIEVLARWFHPGQTRDIDPAATLETLNGFAAVPMEGTYWVDLTPS